MVSNLRSSALLYMKVKEGEFSLSHSWLFRKLEIEDIRNVYLDALMKISRVSGVTDRNKILEVCQPCEKGDCESQNYFDRIKDCRVILEVIKRVGSD
ncbi:hypothetical protein Tco_1021494 [Tanacetum coccineum]